MYVSGQTCPFCQFPIKPGEEFLICPACGIAHHKICWHENGGKCTTFGCRGNVEATKNGHVAAAVATPYRQRCWYCGAGTWAGAVFCCQCGRILHRTSSASAYYPYLMLQGVSAVKYPKAPLDNRLGAYIIDILVAVVPLLPGGILLQRQDAGDLGGILLFFALIWTIWYGFTKDGMPGGQSYGKRACGLMVVYLPTNQPCSKVQSFTRQLGFFLLCFGGIAEIILVLAHEKGQRLGDTLAGTQVITSDRYSAC